MIRSTRTLALALALLAAPAALRAQQSDATPPAQPQVAQPETAQLQAMVTELQQIHQRLQALQARAFQDSALSAAQQALGVSIEAAMNEADPALAQGLERIKAMEGEAQTAQAAQDTARLQTLNAEADKIQQQFFAAQQKVLAQPAMAAKLQAFQEQLEATMVAVDPEAKQLIARFRELEEQLAAATGAR